MAQRVPQKPPGGPPAGNAATPPLPSVPIGTPGYVFRFPVDSPQGQDERREHNRIWKQTKRARRAVAEATALPVGNFPVPDQAPGGEQMPGAPGEAAVLDADFVPWIAKDVADFTDKLVELAEARRVTQFLQIAREAQLPPRLIAEIEKRSHYPTSTKEGLQGCLAECAAKWLNKTKVSAKNKEEAKLLFCIVTIQLQGVLLKRDLREMIEKDQEARGVKTDNAKAPALAVVR